MSLYFILFVAIRYVSVGGEKEKKRKLSEFSIFNFFFFYVTKRRHPVRIEFHNIFQCKRFKYSSKQYVYIAEKTAQIKSVFEQRIMCVCVHLMAAISQLTKSTRPRPRYKIIFYFGTSQELFED